MCTESPGSALTLMRRSPRQETERSDSYGQELDASTSSLGSATKEESP